MPNDIFSYNIGIIGGGHLGSGGSFIDAIQSGVDRGDEISKVFGE